jgi:hypothetical protein
MKAILEFNLPEESDEHSYAISGADALIGIDDVLEEIKTKLKHGSGFFHEWIDPEGAKQRGDDPTLERVMQYIREMKEERRLPPLT